MAVAIRRSPVDDQNDDELDQQTLLQQLQSGPTRSTQPVAVGQQALDVTGGQNSGFNGGGGAQIDTSPTVATQGSSSKSSANPAWDTDGYAAPLYTASNFGGPLAGWDATKWNDPNNQHPKYVVGRILSKYGYDDAGTQQAVQEIMQAYPGTTFDGKDKLTIPGVGTVDFRKGAGAGGQGWQWLDPNDNGAPSGGAMPMAGPDGQPVSSAVNGLMQGSTYSTLMQYLQSILGPEATDQQALLSQMQR